MGKIPQRRSPRFGCRLAEGWSAAASLRRKFYVSEVLQQVMKTLEPSGIFPFIDKSVNMYIPSLRPPPSLLLLDLNAPSSSSFSSLSSTPPSSCHSIASASPSCPRFILLLFLVQTRVSFGLVCALGGKIWGVNNVANKPPASCRGLGLLMWTEIETATLQEKRGNGQWEEDQRAAHQGPRLEMQTARWATASFQHRGHDE